MSETIIDFIRHGEPVGGRRYRGHGCDDPLSTHGWEQMWQAVAHYPHWHQLVTSPMQRCRAFAESLAERLALPLRVDERFKEIGLGSWEGMTPQEVLARDRDAYDAYYVDPARNRPSGAESLMKFIERIGIAFEETAADNVGRRVLVVGHAGVIRAVIGHVLQADPSCWYRIAINYAGVTRIQQSRHGRVLEFHNRRSFV